MGDRQLMGWWHNAAMIISHLHRFIFIKTRKTAGTSIEVFLSSVCGDGDVVTPVIPHVWPHASRNHKGFFNHMGAPKIRQAVGDDMWNRYFKFCVERNPWDKTLSDFYMQRARVNPSLALDRYLESGKLPRNAVQYYSETEGLLVDRVARFERLDSELGEIFSRLGIPFAGSLGVRAKGEYRNDRRHYRDVFTDQQARIVGDIFSDEIALHGYTY